MILQHFAANFKFIFTEFQSKKDVDSSVTSVKLFNGIIMIMIDTIVVAVVVVVTTWLFPVDESMLQ